MGNNDAAYLLARAIQCFTPGIPQIYYVGLLAGENDLELLENSKEGRNINRHYYSLDEINQEIERPVVKDLFRLLAFRNTAKAFDGDLKITMIDEGAFTLTWATAEESASLTVDLPTNKFSILHRTAAGDEQIF